MNVYIYTLGCRLNQAESEAVAERFQNAGFTLSSWSSADIVIVNSCTVTAKAEQKARRMIRRFAERSEVIVTGCYAELEKDEVLSLSDKVTVFSLKEKASLLSLPEHIRTALSAGMSAHEAIVSFTERSDDLFAFDASSFQYHSRAYLKVQDGCDNSCGYCRVHIARGASRSLDRSEVIRRALELEGEGFNEIVLTGVNLTMYDHENEGLGGLMLSLIPRLKGTTRLRLSSMEPDHVDERLIEACSSPAVHPHFHIPVQSASDRVLQRSSRRYSKSHLEWVLNELRRVKDDPFLACDVIAGLPAEGKEEAEETYCFVKDMGFAALHVFPFSPRPDTVLYNAPDRCEERVRDERAERLRQLSGQLHEAYVSRQIGRKLEVLLENRKDGLWHGTTGNYLKVKIENAPPFSIRGELVSGVLVSPDTLRLS